VDRAVFAWACVGLFAWLMDELAFSSKKMTSNSLEKLVMRARISLMGLLSAFFCMAQTPSRIFMRASSLSAPAWGACMAETAGKNSKGALHGSVSPCERSTFYRFEWLTWIRDEEPTMNQTESLNFRKNL
jgi:hypothetical protein